MAAGITRTSWPMTTVPVRALTTTLAGASPGESSTFSSRDNRPMRAPGSVGERTATVTPSTARAVPAPKLLSMAATMRETVVKSF